MQSLKSHCANSKHVTLLTHANIYCMERFVINYPLNGTNGKLFVEQMDHDNHRYSIERDNEDRKLYDSKPVIIEKSESGSWSLATESDWLVNESQAGEI